MRVEENSRTERHVKVMSAEELIEELDRAERSSRRTTLSDGIADERLDTTQSLWFLTRGSSKNAAWRATHVTRPKVASVPGSPFYEAERKYWEKKRDAFVAANPNA